MKNTVLRVCLFRFATALIFMAAIGFMRTESVHATWRPGACEDIGEAWGCTEDSGGQARCWDQFDCVDVSDQTAPLDLCYCMAEWNCGWWPNGCN